MRLILKHLLGSIRRKPLQPIVMVLTLTLSLAVTVLSLAINDGLTEESERSVSAKYGTADVTVTLNGSSRSRFMFADSAKRILGDKAEVAGCYELPLMFGKDSETVFAVAADFTEIGKIFSFNFIEYGKLYRAELDRAVLISRDFARSHSLSVGDSVDFGILGTSKRYTVAGISDSDFMASYDVMLDITSVVGIMCRDSLLLTSLGEGFKPSSTLYVAVSENSTADECINILSADADFLDKSFLNTKENIALRTNTEALTAVMNVIILLACVMTVGVTFCCFYILSYERSDENAAFFAAGAKRSTLALLQYAEIFIYWLAALPFGTLLCLPLLSFAAEYIGFAYAVPRVTFTKLLLGAGILLASAVLTTTLFILSEKLAKKPKSHRSGIVNFTMILPLVLAVCLILLFALPVPFSFTVGVPCLIIAILTVFAIAPIIMRAAFRLLASLFDRRPGRAPALCYAVKNTYSVKTLHNFSRLVATLLTVIFCAMLVIFSANGQISSAKGLFSGEYAVINANDSCYSRVSECESLESSGKAFFGSGILESRHSTLVLSASDMSTLSDNIGADTKPMGNRATISSGQAKMLSLGVGDTFCLELNGKTRELEIAEICESGMNIIIVDCEYFDVSHNMIIVSGKDGYSDSDVLYELSEKTATELAAIVTVEGLMSDKLESIALYVNAGNLLILVIACFALLGLFDNLSQTYRERSDEFELYRTSGMSGGTVTRMKTLEIAFSLLYGLLVALCAFAVCTVIIERGLMSYGYEVLLNTGKYLK